jgi:Cys-rich protein (TIGR01571 family)
VVCFVCTGCVGLFCPCYIFGKNAELLGSGTFAGPCLTHCISWALVNTICCFATNGALLGLPGCFVSCYACGYRKSLRAKYNLQEAPCGDFVTHFFCHLCAICQEYREIREQSSGSYPLDMKMAITNAPLAQTMESAN